MSNCTLKNSMMLHTNDEPCCYLCAESHNTLLNPLVCPCSCKTQHVHVRCLQQWNVQRPITKDMHCCEVCKAPYWGGKCKLISVMSIVWLIESIQHVCRCNND